MSTGTAEQRNPYKGDPARSWIRVQLIAANGDSEEIELVADTGSPSPFVISDDRMLRLVQHPTLSMDTNFGILIGGGVRLAIADVGFDQILYGHASDAV